MSQNFQKIASMALKREKRKIKNGQNFRKSLFIKDHQNKYGV